MREFERHALPHVFAAFEPTPEAPAVMILAVNGEIRAALLNCDLMIFERVFVARSRQDVHFSRVCI